MPLSAVTDIIDPSYTIEGFDVHGSGSDTYLLLCTLGEYESSAEGVVNVGGVIENNEPGRVAVYKVDSTNKSKGLQGAVFMLSNPETFETYYLVTDSSGYAISNYLTVGMWTITEVQAPTGYQNSGWSRTVFITPFTTTVTYTVENTPLSGKVKIIKTATYGGTVSGCQLLTEPVYIGKLPLERDLELEFSVINHLMPTLPATGSSGMLISILAAFILSAAGTALLVVSKRKGVKG